MPKKVTMNQRLLEFGLSASPAEIDAAIDTLKACKAARTPQKPRKPRSDKGTTKGDGNGSGTQTN